MSAGARPTRPTRPWVLGHRGMRGVPENTLPAFERALEVGADGVELDVRVCASGEVVVMHDPDLRRMAGRSERVAELDYAQLRGIDLGQGAHAPLLAEVLALVLGRGQQVNVEIKADAPATEPIVRGVARELSRLTAAERARVVVSSFEPSALVLLRGLDPETRVGFLYSTQREADHAPRLSHAGEHPQHMLLDAASIAAMRARSAFVNTWTVNDPARAVQLAQLGVDAIISDVPDAIVAALRGA
jgi:glycerophosphoryl diester phosphodiesterase